MRTYDNLSLKELNTFGIDATARRLVVVEREDDLAALAPEAPWLILGGGSNVVFTADYAGTVLQLDRRSEAELLPGARVRAWGGMETDDLVRWTLDRGLYGMENLTAIPGTVGASAVQNVGAYGVEAKDLIESVEAYDLQEHRLCRFGAADCRFAYRHSRFKEEAGRYLILRVVYSLRETFVPMLGYKVLEGLPHATATELREAIADLRWQKLPHPGEHGSAGSFFKNPVVDDETFRRLHEAFPDMPSYPGNKLPAGWLIDRCGWKGRTMGQAGVWPAQALVLYNAGGCTGREVVALAEAIGRDVFDKFNVRLDPEAIII